MTAVEAQWSPVQHLMATIETLRDTYRGWHAPMLAGEREQMLREVFSL